MELRELQANLLTIMKKIHAYCVKHNIKYYIPFGTSLGAVRHKGFIPWDDDIDIIMLREDCNRLLELTKTTPIAPDVGVLHYPPEDERVATHNITVSYCSKHATETPSLERSL